MPILIISCTFWILATRAERYPDRNIRYLARRPGCWHAASYWKTTILTAELLMAWPFTAAPWTPTANFGFRVLTEFEDRLGYLSAANGIPEKFDRLTGSERTKYALATTYHTVYVMGMLCALALRP